MTAASALLAVSVVLVVATLLLVEVRLYLKRHHRQHAADLQNLGSRIDGILHISERQSSEIDRLFKRMEDQLAVSRNDLEWMIGDRMIEVAGQYVGSGSTSDDMAHELDMPIDMARARALFRRH
ncbi:MAG: hypothetical protein Q8K20_10810 [Gemmobacter sp.]|jgi:hypothetical protein|nr:hypothetical protein [Gemmobacter sp.]